MAINATKPATPAAVADAVAGRAVPPRGLETAPTVPPPDGYRSDADDEEGDVRIPAGTMISDRYRIQHVLGEGGMGVVYSAEHVLMRKEVAVKVLHAEMCSMPEVVARFEREAIAAAHIDHPNVAGATDFGRLEDGACFLVLELLKGTSLRDEIAKGPIPVGRSLRILRGIASGVSAAHAKGIVHRDLKPENVMLVDREGDIDFVKVLDFGIAKVDATVTSSASGGVGKVLTRVGAVFGTPEYMAPEQAVGDTVDARADLYALGVIFLEMLTGVCPFQGNALSILRERILAVGPPDMSGIEDEGCKALVARLLTRQPDDRMQTGTELVLAIDALLDERRGAGVGVGVAAAAGSMPPPPIASGSSPGVVAAAGVNATTNPVVTTGAILDASPKKNRRWLVVPVGLAAAALIVMGTFALVKAVSKPADSSAASSALSAATPSTTAAEPPPPTPSASAAAAVELDDDPPSASSSTPAPTASAASARATPAAPARAKPNPRPRTKRKDLLPDIPPPSKWVK